MISFKHLAQLSFHFTRPNKANRKEWCLSFIFPIVIGFFLVIFPVLIWEASYVLVVVSIFPQKLMIIINFLVKLLAFLAFAIPFLYTYLVISIKRLHDIGHSGFWWLINLVPVIICIVINYLGQDGWWLFLRIFPIVMFLFILYTGFAKSSEKEQL